MSRIKKLFFVGMLIVILASCEQMVAIPWLMNPEIVDTVTIYNTVVYNLDDISLFRIDYDSEFAQTVDTTINLSSEESLIPFEYTVSVNYSDIEAINITQQDKCYTDDDGNYAWSISADVSYEKSDSYYQQELIEEHDVKGSFMVHINLTSLQESCYSALAGDQYIIYIPVIFTVDCAGIIEEQEVFCQIPLTY